MLKKNQLALILLTLVMMLTIYYIKQPFDKDDINDDTPGDNETGGRLSELQELRVLLRDERTQAVLGLDAVIADNEATIEQKNAALDQKKFINNLTEKELLMELQIIQKGFRDAFVHASDTGVNITVVAEEHSLSAANEIILMTMLGFDKEFEDVHLEFSTVEEVMGNVE